LLTQQHRQEALSRAYIQAVASKLGMSCSIANFDYGIDLTVNHITRIDEYYSESGFKLDIQAKSSVNTTIDNDTVSYALNVRAYENLRIDIDGMTPRILVLLLLPEQETEWLEQDEERLILRRCAYWICLKGYGPTTNSSTITVTIPRANLFNAEGLHSLMDRIRWKGGL
jgi:Domain of unknown function (DUF4365)